MALIKSGNFMGLPMNIQRGNPIPLDDTSVWYAEGVTGAPAGKVGFTAMQTYAASGVTAYVGQILTYVEANTATAYLIADAAGTLVKLAATTTSGDLVADVATLQGKVAALEAAVGKNTEGSETGIYALIKAAKAAGDAAQVTADSALEEAGKKVASVTAADGSITVGGTATAPTLKVNFPKAAEYSITKDDEAQSGYAATYHLTKDGANVGSAINIPKDMVVKSGEVVENPDVSHSGTYLVLTLANATEDKIYINVADLIEYVTSGSADTDMVVIHIDGTTHKVTATVTDKSITKAKLAQAVQDSLDKADSAIQSVALESGTNNGTVKLTVGETVTDNIAITGLGSAAYTDSTAYDAFGAASAVLGTDSDSADKATVHGVKKALTEAQASLTTEIGKKVDKLTSLAGNKPGVYTDNGSGIIALTEVATDATANTIAKRDANGRITVAEPAADTDAATKKYVDEAIAGPLYYLPLHPTEDVVWNLGEHSLTINENVDAGSINLQAVGEINISGTSYAPVNISAALGTVDVNAPTVNIGTGDATNSVVIKKVATPTADTDAANKAYVDTKTSEAVNTGITVTTTGTGNVITGISKTNGTITATKGTLGTADITGLNTALDDKASVRALETTAEGLRTSIAAKADPLKYYSEGNGTASISVSGTISLDSDVGITIGSGRPGAIVTVKGLVDPTADNDAANKKYVDTTIATATAGLSGAMHYVGESTTDPSTGTATVTGVTKFNKGDVVTYQIKEYVYDGTTWREIGTEGSYAVKGSIKDADIANDAAIAQSKISGLTTKLESIDTTLGNKLDSATAATTYETKFNVINCGGAANL